MDFRIYPLKDTARLPELCDLFAKGLAQTTPEMWIWKHYTENGLPAGMILVAEDETGKLRAMFAMQPAWYRKGDERILLVQTEDLVIDPECRGQGLMRKLYDYTMDHYQHQGAAALTAFSCNEASYPIFMKYGAKDLGALSSITTAKRFLPKFWKKRSYHQDGWSVEISDQMPEDLFFTRSDTVFKMEKNARFMQWKFTEDPDRRYQWLAIRHEDALVGYLVFYVNKGRLRSAVNICDWELQERVAADILKKAVGILEAQGNWVNLWGEQSQEDAARWRKAGLTQPGDGKDHFVFHGIDDSTAPPHWHITKADSDN